MYKILVVDDESIEREGIQFLIEKYQFPLEVAQASNGKIAVKYMQSHPIDILLTDVKMPQMDGLELADYTHKNFPNIHILVFSAYGEFDFAKKAMAAQAVSYLLKPIEVDEFQKVMQQLLAQCDAEAQQKQQLIAQEAEQHQYELFRLVTGGELTKHSSLSTLLEHSTLRLLHVQTENDFFAGNEDSFCRLLADEFSFSYEYINTYPDEAYILIYGHPIDEEQILQHLKSIQNNLKQQCSISFIIGREFNDAALIPQRAQSISKLRKVLFEAADSIVSENGINGSVSYYAESIERCRQEVKQALDQKDEAHYLPAAFLLFHQLEQNSALSRVYCYHILYDLLFQLYRAYDIFDSHEIVHGLDLLLSCNTAEAMYKVLRDIVSNLQGKSQNQSADSSSIIRKVQRLVETEYSQMLSLEYLAGKVYLTPSYLSFIFKQETGKNLIRYITDVRMYNAQKMLTDGALKISQIAKNCGYDNTSYFNKMFKNYYGVTPRQYREGESNEGSV